MKNQLSKASFFSLLSLFLFLSLFETPETVETTATAEATAICENPTFPGCQAPDAVDTFRVMLVIDESGSMGSASEIQAVKNTVTGFATVLEDNATTAGQFEMGIIDFDDVATEELPLTDVKGDPQFLNKVDDYKNNRYTPGGFTNYQLALNKVKEVNENLQKADKAVLDIVFFMSDGDPRTSAGVQPTNVWQPLANDIKCPATGDSTYIFGIGIGDGVQDINIIDLSGTDQLSATTSLANGADWTKENIDQLPDLLIELAKSLRDNEAPSFTTCPANIDVVNDQGKCSAVVTFTALAEDNCTAVTLEGSHDSGDEFNVGETTVTIIAKDNFDNTTDKADDDGNKSNCVFKVTVRDEEDPRLSSCPTRGVKATTPDNSCEANVTFNITATDNCTASPTIVSTPASGSSFQLGDTPVTTTVTDEKGNTNICSFIVTVTDDKKPTFTNCPGNQKVNTDQDLCSAVVTFNVRATDNCTANPSIVSTPASGTAFPLGFTTVRSKAKDNAGNIADCVFTIEVEDGQAPSITCPANKTVSNNPGICGARVSFSVSAADNCTANPTITSNHATGSVFPVGATVVTSIATDDAGKSADCSFTITVNDEEPPVVTCPASIRVRNDLGVCGAKVSFTTTATDNCTTNPTITSTHASGSEFPVGVTTVTSTGKDEFDNESDCSFTVTVRDQEPPSISCPPNITINIEDSTDPSNTGTPTVGDNCSANPPSHRDRRINGSCNSEFTLNRNWRVTDIHSNANGCVQIIQVIDVTPPVLTLPDNITVTCDTTTAATGVATATDNGDPNPVVGYSDEVVEGDCTLKCVINRTWTATDECGNSNSKIQKITKDVTPKVNEALTDNNGNPAPLVLGFSQTTLTINRGDAGCIVRWLPYVEGSVEGLLPRDRNVTVTGDCLPGGNKMQNGRITNPMLGEALLLNLYLRLNPEFGEKKLSDIECVIPPIVKQLFNMDHDQEADINEFRDRVNDALPSNLSPVQVNGLLEVLRCITGPIELCD